MNSVNSFYASPVFDLEVSSDDEDGCRDSLNLSSRDVQAESIHEKAPARDHPRADSASSIQQRINMISTPDMDAVSSLSFRRGISLVCDTRKPTSTAKDNVSVDDYALEYDGSKSPSFDGVYPISSLSYSASPRAYQGPGVHPEQGGSVQGPFDESQVSNPSTSFHAWKFRQLQSSPISRISKLLQNQRARFGMDMFQAIIDDSDQRDIEHLQESQGFSFEEAALYKFNKLRGLALPEPGRLSKRASDARPRAIQCVRIPSPKTPSHVPEPAQQMPLHHPPSPGNTSQQSYFSFLSSADDDTQSKGTLGVIEDALSHYHVMYEEFFGSLPTAHYTALRELLS